MNRAVPLSETPPPRVSPATLTHLQRLEAESIHIMREVVAECDRPVMLYSIGKDSSVMLHLAVKAFHPALPPFPLLHVDTTWKFRAMYEFRDATAKRLGLQLLVHVNQEGLRLGIGPFSHGSQVHTDVMKTQALRQALDQYGFDAAFGGDGRCGGGGRRGVGSVLAGGGRRDACTVRGVRRRRTQAVQGDAGSRGSGQEAGRGVRGTVADGGSVPDPGAAERGG